MNFSKRAVVSCVAAALYLSAFSSALAARIYNELPADVYVYGMGLGGGGGALTVRAKRRSESISWDARRIVIEMGYSRREQICSLDTWPHAELNGGHYLVIGHEGPHVTCALCDSDYHEMKRDTHTVSIYHAGLFQQDPATKDHC